MRERRRALIIVAGRSLRLFPAIHKTFDLNRGSTEGLTDFHGFDL